MDDLSKMTARVRHNVDDATGGTGAGGAGVIYVPGMVFSSETPSFCYKDRAGTEQLDYATGKEMLINGAPLCVPGDESNDSYVVPVIFNTFDPMKGVLAFAYDPDTSSLGVVGLAFSDSTGA